MALCSSGSMSLGGSTVGRSVNCELGCSGTASINMDRADVRDLAEKSSGAISMSDFYGKSSGPSAIGDSYEGGFYMGDICVAGSCYYLILASNAGGCGRYQWKTSFTGTPNTRSLVDGYSNTYGPMDNAEHPAGNFCATRTLGGFSDWYLPAFNELQVLYSNGIGNGPGNPLPEGEEFIWSGSDSVWSSTEYFSGGACALYLFNGNSNGSDKCQWCHITRAVRREPI